MALLLLYVASYACLHRLLPFSVWLISWNLGNDDEMVEVLDGLVVAYGIIIGWWEAMLT